MSYKFIKREVENYLKLPPGAFYIKTKNGKRIYKNKYNDKDMLDGVQWELKLEVGGKQLISWGSNKFPASFRAFVRSVNDLLEDNFFDY